LRFFFRSPSSYRVVEPIRNALFLRHALEILMTNTGAGSIDPTPVEAFSGPSSGSRFRVTDMNHSLLLPLSARHAFSIFH